MLHLCLNIATNRSHHNSPYELMNTKDDRALSYSHQQSPTVDIDTQFSYTNSQSFIESIKPKSWRSNWWWLAWTEIKWLMRLRFNDLMKARRILWSTVHGLWNTDHHYERHHETANLVVTLLILVLKLRKPWVWIHVGFMISWFEYCEKVRLVTYT